MLSVFPRPTENVEWFRSRSDARTGERFEQSWRRIEMASVTSTGVCDRCNTGWMSRLEERARPLLTPMILGRPTALSQPEQLTVATWATKTAMTLETTLRHDGMFTSEECQIVRVQDRPPAHLFVVSAMIEGLIPPLRYALKRLAAPHPASELHVHTIQIHTLVLQVIRIVPALMDVAAFRDVLRSAGQEIAVFPPVDEFFWPPPTSLGPDTYEPYTSRYMGEPEQ